MLAKVSKRIGEILQTQDQNPNNTPKAERRRNEVFDRSRISQFQSSQRTGSNEKRQKMPPRSSGKPIPPPKSAHDILYSPIPKVEKEPVFTKSIGEMQTSNLNWDTFLNLYREQLLSLVRPLVMELESRIIRRLDQIERELRVVSEMASLQSVQTPLFNTLNKTNTLDETTQLEINSIMAKAEQISIKIEDNQLKIVSRFKEVESEIRFIKEKAIEKCSCFNHLEAIVETQNYLCEEIKVIKQHMRRPSP